MAMDQHSDSLLVGSEVKVKITLTQRGTTAVGPYADFHYSIRVPPGASGRVLAVLPDDTVQVGFQQSECELDGHTKGYHAKGRFAPVIKMTTSPVNLQLLSASDIGVDPPNKQSAMLGQSKAATLGDPRSSSVCTVLSEMVCGKQPEDEGLAMTTTLLEDGPSPATTSHAQILRPSPAPAVMSAPVQALAERGPSKRQLDKPQRTSATGSKPGFRDSVSPPQKHRVETRIEWWARVIGPGTPSLTKHSGGGTGRQYGGGCGGGYDPTWSKRITVYQSGRLEYSMTGTDESGFRSSDNAHGEWQLPAIASVDTDATTTQSGRLALHLVEQLHPDTIIHCTWHCTGSTDTRTLPMQLDISRLQ